MIVVTTEQIEGKRIVQTLGLVAGTMGGSGDLTYRRGVQSPAQQEFEKARQKEPLLGHWEGYPAIYDMSKKAEAQGANAIVETRFFAFRAARVLGSQ